MSVRRVEIAVISHLVHNSASAVYQIDCIFSSKLCPKIPNHKAHRGLRFSLGISRFSFVEMTYFFYDYFLCVLCDLCGSLVLLD